MNPGWLSYEKMQVYSSYFALGKAYTYAETSFKTWGPVFFLFKLQLLKEFSLSCSILQLCQVFSVLVAVVISYETFIDKQGSQTQTRSTTLKSKTFNRSYLDLKICPWSVKPCYCSASWDRLPPTQCWAMSAGERYKHWTTEGLSRLFFAAALSVTISWTSTHLLSYWLLSPPSIFFFFFSFRAIDCKCKHLSWMLR